MGTNYSMLSYSLLGWWTKLRHNETLIYGPQIAFNLRSPQGQTVLLFGENHTYENLPKCGPDEKTFTQLFSDLIDEQKCEELQIILELSQWTKEQAKSSNIIYSQSNRIVELMKRYYEEYIPKESCKITLQFANPDRSNSKLVSHIRNIQNTSDISSLINNEYYMSILKEELITSFNPFRKNMSNMMIKLPNDTVKILKETLVDKLLKEITDLESELNNITEDNILLLTQKAYFIVLRTIDVYGIIMVLSTNINTIVYMGVLHSSYIISYLVINFGYILFDMASPISDHCIKIDDDAYDNIYVKLKKMINAKQPSEKEYLNDIFSNMEARVRKNALINNDKLLF